MAKVVIIGSGIMSVGIAAGFIHAGIHTVLLARSLDKAQAALGQAAGLLDALGPMPGQAGQAQAGLLDSFDDWTDVEWVLETVKEDFDLKREIFASLDSRVPAHIPIGSNSSSYPITRIAQGLATRSRMFNAHYFMPAHLVPLVEVALGEDSDPAMGEAVCALYRRVGKKPVLVKRDIPGFLANRIQHALMREALALIDSGIASPEDVDTAVRYSFGFRYAASGPIMQKEISGWDTMGRAAAEIYPSLSNTDHVADCIDQMVKAGKTGMKTGAGFFEWTPERARAERANYDQRLQAAFRVLKMD